ncbi:MAG TPA: hypothetical protein VKQ28_01525 [Candidatus Acidoferrum sp.]|nr:hypothetical protein [Candidatus Acidoferrum sp.]
MAFAPPVESNLRDQAPAHMIARGYFRILNFFDIAEAIDLEKLRVLLGPQAAPRSPAFVHLTPEYAQAQNPPLEESLDPFTLPGGEKLEGKIKYYWFGVASVQLTTPFQCDLDNLCGDSYRWMNAPEVEKAAEELLRGRLERFRPALIKPSSKWLDEDYLVIDIQSAQNQDGRAPTATELLERYGDQLTQLVRGELTSLSAAERDEILRGALSYYPSDLIVAGWAAALVYDKPDATSAIIDLLEYANTQLLEFRFYDELLTTLLSNVYSSLEGHESFLSRWRLPRRAGRLNRLRLDIMDLAERTEYAVKFISDTYYARVYKIISSKIGVEDYKALVAEKLKTAGELYEFMVAQFNERRMFALELVVAVLVALDVILLLRWH